MAKITGKYEVLYIIDPTLGEEGKARRGNPSSFGNVRNLIIGRGKRIATVAALPRNDREITVQYHNNISPLSTLHSEN